MRPLTQPERNLYNRSVDVLNMPSRIRALPISPTGFPVPWFVEFFKDGKPCERGEGVPDFRVIDPRKIDEAIHHQRCWICGQGPISVYKCFVIGVMCAITRTISEPPSHRDCAIFAAKNCPFLAKPNAVRNEKGLTDESGKPRFNEPAGVALKRNPGVCVIWITKGYKTFSPDPGSRSILFSLGRPTEVIWLTEGRRATRKEVMAAIDAEDGYPELLKMARQEGKEALAALATQREVAMALVPD
jgi:hypothetical protein